MSNRKRHQTQKRTAEYRRRAERVEAVLKAHPEVAWQPINAPVEILGSPRFAELYVELVEADLQRRGLLTAE